MADLMSLIVRIGADTQEAENGISKVSKLGNSLSKGLKIAAKGATVAVGAATTAVGLLVRSAVKSYARYEQLVGGVETLYKTSSKTVQEYAENAYKTAGLSANDYMEQATSFAAALVSSLGGDTEKAAKRADMAITDMADNANKMGTSMESLQNAYSGFAKGNFTMLDNLKLGYGGTKEEMQRLLDKAEEISGYKYDISSYADIVEAIHVVQEEMGITGTTAKEADSTIQGSLAATKAAWENVMVAISGGNIDLGESIDALVESGINTINNIWPAISRALKGVGELVKRVAPIIAKNLPGMVQDVLPDLLDAATTLLGGVAAALPGLFKVVLDAVGDLFVQLKSYIDEKNPELGQKITAIADFFVSAWETVKSSFQTLVDFWEQTLQPALQAIWDFIVIDVVPAITTAFDDLVAFWNETLVPAVDVIKSAFQTFWEEVIVPLASYIRDTFYAAFTRITTYWENTLKPKIEALKTAFNGFKTKVLSPIAEFLGGAFTDAWEAIKNLFTGSGGVKSETETLGTAFRNLYVKYIQPVAEYVSGTLSTAWSTFEGVLDGVITFLTGVFSGNWQQAWEGLSNIVSNVFDALVDILKVPINGIIDLINSMINAVESGVNSIINGINNNLRVRIPAIEIGWPINRSFGGLDWGPNLSTVSWGRISRLATGGVLGDGQRAIVGEYRPEMLSVINGHAVVQPIGGIQPRDRLGGGATNYNTVNVYTQPGQDAEEIAREVQKIFVSWDNQAKAVFA